MTSLHRRYLAGEHAAVWADIRALGPVPAARARDVDAVAGETMRRAARHVARIAAALPGLGFIPAHPDLPVHGPPGPDDAALVAALAEEIGGLPAALAACLREVGAVSFVGDCPALGLAYHTGGGPDVLPDPLDLAPAGYLRTTWEEHEADPEWDGPFEFDLAPDELHKANVGGGSFVVELPDRAADPVLHGVRGRTGVTLVEYLRVSVAWGGFPGWEFAAPHQVPAALADLRAEPDF